ncbi:MAG: ASPIC/UnbV domain-containing protein [Candidatus Latescibacterota bacterium]|nr:ASPIC/UnbV domain-containing protein [Candidatus Latescibacterota bacterium]
MATPTLPMLGWGTHFIDADLDGWLDLFVANGHVYPQVDVTETGAYYAQPNQLFRGLGDGSFAAVTGGPEVQLKKVSRGSCVGDYDDDGDTDIFVVNLNDTPSLLRNDTASPGNWLGVRLRGSYTPDVAGARVTVTTQKGRQVRTANRAAGYLGANDPVLRSGIGAALIAAVTVAWPNGERTNLKNVEANQVIVVRERAGRG